VQTVTATPSDSNAVPVVADDKSTVELISNPRLVQATADGHTTSRVEQPQDPAVSRTTAMQPQPVVERRESQVNTQPQQTSRPATAIVNAIPMVKPEVPQRCTSDKAHAVSASNEESSTTPSMKDVEPMRQREQASAAVARAAQVEMGVRLENATGLSPVIDAPSPNAVPTQSKNAVPTASLRTGINQLGQSLIFTDQASEQARSETPFSNQVVRGLTSMLNQRGGVMNMRLDPPELGALRVHMTIARGIVSAEFQPTSQQAQGLLEKSMATLRHALESQGLTVDRLSVHVAQASGSGAGAQFWRDDASNAGQHSQSRQSHDAAGQESRGRHEQQGNDQRQRFQATDFETLFHTTTNN
jgi:flagellar hook-length control protein FliK